jgi:hypothetical protein
VYRPGPVKVQMYPTVSLLNLAAFGGQVERTEGWVHLCLRGARSVHVYLSSRGQTPLA